MKILAALFLAVTMSLAQDSTYPQVSDEVQNVEGKIKVKSPLIFDIATNGIPVTFSIQATLPTGTTLYWYFGDGMEKDGNNVTHLYKKTGVFVVKVQVIEKNGNQHPLSFAVRINKPVEIIPINPGDQK